MQRGDIISLSPAASKGAHSFLSKTRILSAAELDLSFLSKGMELMQNHRAAERTEEENLGEKNQAQHMLYCFLPLFPWMADQGHFSK